MEGGGLLLEILINSYMYYCTTSIGKVNAISHCVQGEDTHTVE